MDICLTPLLRLYVVHKHNFPVFHFVYFPRALEVMHTYERAFPSISLKISILWDVTCVVWCMDTTVSTMTFCLHLQNREKCLVTSQPDVDL